MLKFRYQISNSTLSGTSYLSGLKISITQESRGRPCDQRNQNVDHKWVAGKDNIDQVKLINSMRKRQGH